MGSISTWHVTLKHRCEGAQVRWTSTPGTIQNSMRQSISASPPISMDLHTPTRSDYDYTVRLSIRESSVCLNAPLTYVHCTMYSDLSVFTLNNQDLSSSNFSYVACSIEITCR